MEIGQLRAFRSAAELLSFTRAAERLNVTQSAVSQQIRALEEELGEPLFVRARRRVALSPAGHAVLDHARRVLEEVDQLRGRFGGPAQAPRGRVRAAAATQAFVHLFAPLFEQFMKAHPAVDLIFRTTSSTEQTVADILSGTADVGFASLPAWSPSLQVSPLFEDELMLVTGSSHAAAARREVTVDELAGLRFILFERGASIRRATDQFFNRVGIRPELALESNDTYFVKLMVEHGLGASLLPAWAVRDEVAAGRLAWMRVAGHRLRRSVSVISMGRLLPSATRAFLDFILGERERLQQLAAPET